VCAVEPLSCTDVRPGWWSLEAGDCLSVQGHSSDVDRCLMLWYVMFEVPHHDLDTLQTIFQKDGWTPVKRSNGMS
jgi:hypothetical protein